MSIIPRRERTCPSPPRLVGKLILPLILAAAAVLSLSSIEKIGTDIGNATASAGHYAQLAQIDE